jgi:hypothetical protein
MNMSDYGVKIGIKADTGIMLLKPSTVSAVFRPDPVSDWSISKKIFSSEIAWSNEPKLG